MRGWQARADVGSLPGMLTVEWTFRSPTHDEFLKVVVEILFVKRRRVDRVEELFEVPDADPDSILASSSC